MDKWNKIRADIIAGALYPKAISIIKLEVRVQVFKLLHQFPDTESSFFHGSVMKNDHAVLIHFGKPGCPRWNAYLLV